MPRQGCGTNLNNKTNVTIIDESNTELMILRLGALKNPMQNKGASINCKPLAWDDK